MSQANNIQKKLNRPLALGLMASGNGSNAEAVMQWCRENPELATVKVLLCDKPGAFCLERARKFSVPVLCMPYPINKLEKKSHEEKMAMALKEFDLDWILLTGYMRILSTHFLHHFKFGHEMDGCARIVNIHPSLLPQFKGAHAYEDAFSHGVKESGVTIHMVNDQLDSGRILIQKSFTRESGDSLQTFRERGQKLEMAMWPEFLTLLSSGRATCL